MFAEHLSEGKCINVLHVFKPVLKNSSEKAAKKKITAVQVSYQNELQSQQ